MLGPIELKYSGARNSPGQDLLVQSVAVDLAAAISYTMHPFTEPHSAFSYIEHAIFRANRIT